MAELPWKVHLTSHPMYLDIRGPALYEDEYHRTWLHLVTKTGGDLQVRLRQENIPIGDIALTTSPLTSISMPSLWKLHLGIQYLDSMGRFWRIVHHIKENGVEEMILELMEDSLDM
ncbi:Protein p13 MTCP-1 [Myotis brandtii]|uniref:Protein p13 MTCP-1 n=1 Tax=Myotis brandtii TaxID=109478 RepID=S7MMX7_MYOBR|nr:PREDICTED: protein p13 MTCP-1 [Myotis brandtii]EPQ05649.1 Protein p13 MTCP-1 [Myotis brandtii]